jgi:hypothetical protein
MSEPIKPATVPSVDDVVHTPGPWAWEAHDPSMTTLGTSDGSGGVNLAMEVLSVSRCKSCQKDPENRLCHMPNAANAKLIAAAPELLEAIQAALRIESLWLPPEGENNPEYDAEFAALAMMRNQFKAVVAKVV